MKEKSVSSWDRLSGPCASGERNLTRVNRNNSNCCLFDNAAVWLLILWRHPERSRFSGGAKDLPLDRLGVCTPNHTDTIFLANRHSFEIARSVRPYFETTGKGRSCSELGPVTGWSFSTNKNCRSSRLCRSVVTASVLSSCLY